MKLIEQRIELPGQARLVESLQKETMLTESTMCCRWVAYRMCMALCRMSITCMSLRRNCFWLRLQQTSERTICG